MRIKVLLLLVVLGSGTARSQHLEDVFSLDILGGWAGTTGNMAQANPSGLTHNGIWQWGFGFSKFSEAGKLAKKDMLVWQFGYDFQYNYLDRDELNFETEPQRVRMIRNTQLVHGPYVRMQYTVDYSVQPFMGIGAHLSAVRGSEFTLEYEPDQSYYRQIKITPGGWGRINPTFSANAGIRFTTQSRLAVTLMYEILLRNSWTSKYYVNADPHLLDGQPLEDEDGQFVTQLGWMHRIGLQFNIDL